MVSLLTTQERIDVHNYPRRMERALRHLENHQTISENNKPRILQYLAHLEDEGLSLARRVTHLVRLTRIAETLGKDFDAATEEDMRLLMRNLRTRKTTRTNSRDSNRELSERSIGDYQNTVRKFWRWLKAPSGREIDATWNPPETAWMKTVTFEKNVLPGDILRPEEKDKMLEVAHHPRDKAYVETSWDSGARPGEILSLRIRDIEFDEYGAVMTIRRGKTGDRRVRLIESVPSLATWINNHPFRADSNSPTWVNIGTVNHEERWDYFAARKLLRELAEKAGIRKRVTAYSFRHARATQLANYLTEAQLCQHFGWRQGSKMPRTYVHLSGRDVDNRLLELHGLKPKLEGELIQTVKVCIRCSAKNGPESRFCNRCGLPVDLKTALQLDTRIERAEELMEVLLRDSEVKALLTQKLRELRLAEKFG
jgi:integrase/ribosomal protein L40E